MTSRSGAAQVVPAAPVYALRGCELRVASREIVGHDGPRPIEPRAFDVLLYLIEQRDRVVSKEELLRQVWRRVAVSDSVVARTVMKVRLAIGDLQPDAPLIRTTHRVGYRFVGSVGLAGPAAVREPAPAAAEEFVQLALLPFENRTGRLEKAWLELGVMSQVATALAAYRRLRVAAVSSVLSALEGADDGDAAQRAQVLRGSLGVPLVVHVAVSGSGGSHALRATIHGAQGERELPAIDCPCSSLMVSRLVDLLLAALLPAARWERLSAPSRFLDRFLAEAHARACQAMAEQHWRAALPLLQVLVDQQPDATDLRLDLLRALAHLGDAVAPAVAWQLLQAAAPDDPGLKASVLRELGAYELSIGRLSEAADHLDAALAHRGGGDEFLLCALMPRIRVALEQNDFETARLHLGQAESLIACSANRVHRTAWLRHAAQLEHRSGQLERAAGLAEEALASARDLRLRHCVMAGLWTKSGVLADSGHLDDALACGEEALALAIALGDTRYVANAGATLCVLLVELRRVTALERVLATLEDEAAGDDRWIAGALVIARGCLAYLRRDPAGMAGVYAAVGSLHPGAKFMLLRLRLWPGAGLALVQAGLRQEALALIDEVRAACRSDADAAHCGGLDLLRGHLAFVAGDRTVALRHFVAASERAAGIWSALACLDGAWLCCEAGDIEAAERLLRRAGRWVDEHPAGMLAKARLEHAFGRTPEAIAWQQRHDAALADSGSAERSRELLTCYRSGRGPGLALRLPSQA